MVPLSFFAPVASLYCSRQNELLLSIESSISSSTLNNDGRILCMVEMCDALRADAGHQADDANLQDAIKKLKNLATDLQDKANICLLLLHLEASTCSLHFASSLWLHEL